MVRFILLATLLGVGGPAAPAERPRLVVLTDISSLDAGEAEPDDGQSLIRLMLYAERVRHRGPGRHLEHGARSAGPARVDPAGRGRLRRGTAQPHPARRPLSARLRPRRRHQGGPAGRRAEDAGQRQHRRGEGHRGVGVDHPGRGPARSPAGLGAHLGRVGRPGPGVVEGPCDPEPRRACSLPGQAAGPRHRRPGLDRAVDPGAVPRPVHDHPAAGLPGHVPGRRYRRWPRPPG